MLKVLIEFIRYLRQPTAAFRRGRTHNLSDRDVNAISKAVADGIIQAAEIQERRRRRWSFSRGGVAVIYVLALLLWIGFGYWGVFTFPAQLLVLDAEFSDDTTLVAEGEFGTFRIQGVGRISSIASVNMPIDLILPIGPKNCGVLAQMLGGSCQSGSVTVEDPSLMIEFASRATSSPVVLADMADAEATTATLSVTVSGVSKLKLVAERPNAQDERTLRVQPIGSSSMPDPAKTLVEVEVSKDPTNLVFRVERGADDPAYLGNIPIQPGASIVILKVTTPASIIEGLRRDILKEPITGTLQLRTASPGPPIMGLSPALSNLTIEEGISGTMDIGGSRHAVIDTDSVMLSLKHKSPVEIDGARLKVGELEPAKASIVKRNETSLLPRRLADNELLSAFLGGLSAFLVSFLAIFLRLAGLINF